MKVVLINSVFGTKSTGKIISDIYNYYSSRNAEILVGYGRGKIAKNLKINSYKISNGICVIFSCLISRIFDNEGLNNYFSTRIFLKKLDKFHPDVIWLHNIHGYYINYRLLFKWIKQHPEVSVKWTLHDCWSFTGHCCYFDFVKCNKWINGCDNCAQKFTYPKSLICSRSKHNYLSKRDSFSNLENIELICPSKWLAGLVSKSFLNKYPVLIKKNIIDKNVFNPKKSNFRIKHKLENKFIVLGVASVWEKRKGLEDFIKLDSLLDSNKFQIVLVGKLNKRRLKKNNIIHIKRTYNSIELAEIYSSADVFFNPTHEENFPTVNLEAEACGCPVITYDTGGCSETINSTKSVCLSSCNILDAVEIIKKWSNKYENSSN